MLLEPSSIRVLGGRVESLASAWEIQRLYAGIDRPKGSDESPAPPFCHYSPPVSEAHRPQGQGQGKGKGQCKEREREKEREGHQMEQNPPPPPPPPPNGNSNSSSNNGSSLQGKEVSADERLPNKAPSIVKAALMSAAVSSHRNVLKTGQEPSSSSNGDPRSCLDKEGRHEEEKEGRRVEVAPVALSFRKAGEAASASQQKLLDQMQSRERDGSGRFGREGGRRGGGGRRRRGGLYDDDEEDGKTMTIEEYESRKEEEKRTVMASILTSTPRDQMDADEELARRLHEQMMMEEREERERERAVGRLDRDMRERGRGRGRGRARAPQNL